MKLTPGKLAGMKAVSNERGVIAAAAMDQRGSLQKALAKEMGSDISDAMMQEFKTLVTEVLTQHASAILLDPEWGLPASKRRAKATDTRLQRRIQEIEKLDVKKKRQIMQLLDTFIANEKLRQKVEAKQAP